jgi:hypothetical protein
MLAGNMNDLGNCGTDLHSDTITILKWIEVNRAERCGVDFLIPRQ